MAQVCPACKRRYVGEDLYCQECGEPLIPAAPPWRKWGFLGLGAVVVIAGIWSGVGYIESDLRENVKFDLNEPTFDKAAKEIRLPVVVHNNSMSSFTVESVSCQASILGIDATCADSELPTEVPRQATKTVTLHIAVQGTPALAGIISSQTAQIKVRTWGISVERELEIRSRLASNAGNIRDWLSKGETPNPVSTPAPGPSQRKKPAGKDTQEQQFETDKVHSPTDTTSNEVKKKAEQAFEEVKKRSQQ